MHFEELSLIVESRHLFLQQQGVQSINDVQVNVVKKNDARAAITNAEAIKNQLFNNNGELISSID
jgi:hypothetical protein